MNLNGYIEKFGKRSFKTFPFNDVDALVLSQLTYINLDQVVSSISENKKPIKIKDFKIKDMSSFTDGSVDKKFDIKMIDLLMKSRRFKDISAGYYLKSFSKDNVIQYFSITYFLPDGSIFISYRGTDTTLIGWKEDFILAFEPTIPSHELATTYAHDILNKYNDRDFYLGGHSKGGNIAFYVACHLNELESNRLIFAYSFDGPGFKSPIRKYPSYDLNKDKMLKYLTYNDMIGYFYDDVEPYKIVHSNGLLLGGHDPFYWKINNNGMFMSARSTSTYAKARSKRFSLWLNSLSKKDTKLIFDTIFDLFGENNTIYDLGKNLPKNLVSGKSTLDSYPDEARKKLSEMLKSLVKFMIGVDKNNIQEDKEVVKIENKD